MATGNEHQPLAVDAELDIDGQLDALLEQIEQAEPGLIARDAPRSPAPEPAVSPADLLEGSFESVEAVVEPVEAAAEPAVEATSATPAEATPAAPAPDEAIDTSGLDLASQIQQLLDDARTHHAEPSSAASSPAPAAPVAPAAMPRPVKPAPAASAEQDALPETLNIQDIDQMLAEEADQALAGDFETIHEVLAAEQLPEAPVTPDPEPVAMSPSPASPAAPPAQEAAEDDELEGSFEEPDAVLQQAAMASTGRSELSEDARAVAQELDDQPENRVRAAAAQSTPAATPSEDRETAAPAPSLIHRGFAFVGRELVVLTELVRQLCVLISRPMASLTPQSRDMVGYVGLITLFWGGVALVAKLLFVMRG